MKGVDDDDEGSKKPEVLSSLPVTADGHTHDQKKSSKRITSKKEQSETRLLSATSSQQQLSSHSFNVYNHSDLGQGDVAYHNTSATAESGLLLEKQRIAGRQVMVSTPKQEAFAEEATVEEMTPGIYEDMITGSTHLDKETIIDGSFAEEATVEDITVGLNKNKITSYNKFDKKAMMNGSFAEEAPADEVTTGINDDIIKGSTQSNKNTMMDGSKKIMHDVKIAIMPMTHNSYPLSQYSVKSHDPLMSYQHLDATHPGALAMFPTDSVGSVPTTTNDDTLSVQDESQHHLLASTGDGDIEAFEPALNAVLVTDDLASATILDIEAEKKFHKRRRIRTMIGTLIVASIIAVVVAVPVVLTRPGPPAATFSPSSSPIPSATPSFLPTASPSIHPSSVPSSSPSSGLLGFLAANSFDSGMMLAIAGSSQQRAMDWLLEVSGLSEMNYYLLQTYALVTLYFETHGKQWISELAFAEKRLDLGSFPNKDSEYKGEWLNITPSVNPNAFCDWQGVLCNDNREIDSLNLSSNRLQGSLPAELGMLHQSLSKFTILLA